MKIIHFNRNEEYIGKLMNVTDLQHTEEVNGENFLELTTSSEVDKKDRLMYKDREGNWHEFVISNIEEYREGQAVLKNIYAEHSIYETLGDFIEDELISEESATDALTVALIPTRWSVGNVTIEGLNSAHFYNISSRNAMQKIINTWGGELQYRIIVNGDQIVARYVDILNRRGEDINRRFTYTKNLESIKKTIQEDDVITALYGYGKGTEVVQGNTKYTKRLDFSSINGGKAYVESSFARNIWGRGPAGSKVHVFGKVEFDDCNDKHLLLALTQAKLDEFSQPKITYEATIFDMATIDSRYRMIQLGDGIFIIDEDFKPELRLSSRVIKIKKDLLNYENSEITLGNFAPTVTDVFHDQNYILSNFKDRQNLLDTEVTLKEKKKVISTSAPSDTDTIWFDISEGTSAICKIFYSGSWIPVVGGEVDN